MVSVRRFALAWRFLEPWPDLESAQNVSCQKLKAFLIRDARSCPTNVDQMINQIRDALPATQDRAVVNSSAVFTRYRGRTSTLADDDPEIREADRSHRPTAPRLSDCEFVSGYWESTRAASDCRPRNTT